MKIQIKYFDSMKRPGKAVAETSLKKKTWVCYCVNISCFPVALSRGVRIKPECVREFVWEFLIRKAFVPDVLETLFVPEADRGSCLHVQVNSE